MTTPRTPDDELLALDARLIAASDVDVAPGATERIERRLEQHMAAHPRRSFWRRLTNATAVTVPIAGAGAAAVVALLLLTGPRTQTAPAPATATPSPGVQASPSPSGLAAGCRLSLTADSANNPVGPGWFLDLDTGRFTPDPASKMTLDTTTAAIYSVAQPVLRGDSTAPSYDAAVKRWLPVLARAVSPDGMSYAYVDYSQMMSRSPGQGPINQPIHVVNLTTGADRVLVATGQFDGPTWLPDGIYVVHHLAQTDHSNGIWRIDPASGVIEQVDSSGIDWDPIVRGGAWSSHDSSASADPKTRPGSGDTITRIDLATGRQTDWFSEPGTFLQMIGYMADGRPVVSVSSASAPGTSRVLAMESPGHGTRLDFPAINGTAGNAAYIRPALADHDTTWFLAQKWIYRATAQGIKLVTAGDNGPAGPLSAIGPCR